MSAPYSLKTIRLNLARTKDFPNGSDRHGYRFTAPLDAEGHLDAEGWKKHRDRCRVVRFWAGEEDDVADADRLAHARAGVQAGKGH